VNIHEYQAKDILRAEGVPIPPGEVATTPDEVEAIAKKIGGMVVVKAQVHTGGRGKAGGVKLAKSPAEAREIASRILGMKINGLTVYKVLVTSAADIASEAGVSRQAVYLHFGNRANLLLAAVQYRDRMMPPLEVDDLLAILDAGAYGSVMASNYNRHLLPAEVLVDGGTWTVIRRRQTLDDVLALES